ncbi:MAG: copper homeostasis protein CutC [Daejeonella sp.]|uniref:copper homeostasis protein CutC n=1 Tax=Daejeonella sp. JGW-45 TaxID=3034148 RepID=UPI0023EDE83E|nr:copper homeostasis protein CutC [Daejeonella sp. JGW-45]
MNYTLEICAGSLASVSAAADGGADRIELCDNLSEGGTTPSYGMIKTCISLFNIPVFPIIRPRGGDFVYSRNEFEVMKQDVACCAESGCPGVVFGILKADGSIDTERCEELMALAGTMQVTFHRAFDRCNDLLQGLEDVIDLGFSRILTSGGEASAEDGIPLLAKLIKKARKRIIIMPGSGITTANLPRIIEETGAIEFHSTAKSKMTEAPVDMIQNSVGDQYPYQTDIEKVKLMRQILRAI